MIFIELHRFEKSFWHVNLSDRRRTVKNSQHVIVANCPTIISYPSILNIGAPIQHSATAPSAFDSSFLKTSPLCIASRHREGRKEDNKDGLQISRHATCVRCRLLSHSCMSARLLSLLPSNSMSRLPNFRFLHPWVLIFAAARKYE
jgi:hypothetical protein